MGIQSDREIVELICGYTLLCSYSSDDKEILDLLSPSLQDSCKSIAKTQAQALEYIGGKIKMTAKSFKFGVKATPTDWANEATDLLATAVLAHVPVPLTENGELNFRPKAIYIAVMVRRVLQGILKGGIVDDRDFVGNKRLELFVYHV